MRDNPLARLPHVGDLTPVDLDVWHLRGAFSGFLAVAAAVVATAVTDQLDLSVVLVAVCGVVVGAVGSVIGHVVGLGRHQRSLMWWPAAALGTLVALSGPAPEATTLLVGIIVLSFLFVGLTQPTGTGLACVPVGIVIFLVISDLTVQEAVIRLPIAIVVWIVVSEVPARLLDELFDREQALREAAATDSLTGLLNRSDLDLHLGALTSDSAVMIVDLDHFKRYNDEHGHVQGDVALTTFAAVLAENRRSGDLVYRFGGEEFLVLLPLATPDDALAVARRMADALAATSIGLTFSGGIARAGRGAVERADAALYAAKRAGRDRVLVAEEPAVSSDG